MLFPMKVLFSYLKVNNGLNSFGNAQPITLVIFASIVKLSSSGTFPPFVTSEADLLTKALNTGICAMGER